MPTFSKYREALESFPYDVSEVERVQRLEAFKPPMHVHTSQLIVTNHGVR